VDIAGLILGKVYIMFQYRGKSKAGKWIYGWFVKGTDGYFIFTDGFIINPDFPEYHYQGMGCGLEDRNITDRYEAMQYGWEEAINEFYNNLPEFIEVHPDSIAMNTGIQDKNRIDIYGSIEIDGELTHGGDDITLNYGIPPITENLSIIWTNQEYIGDFSVSGWWMKNKDPGKYSSSLSKDYEMDIEIIGNQYKEK